MKNISRKGMSRSDKLFSTVFIGPTFILYTVFVMAPILISVYYAMTKWDGVGTKKFIGLRNFEFLFQNSDYWITFGNSMQVIAFSLILQIPLGLLFAYLVYGVRRGFKVYRSIYFLPVVIAPSAVGLMFLLFFNGELGPINLFLESVGLQALQHNWLSDSGTVLYAVMFPMIWQYIGYYFVIFLASLQSIPEEIFESAKIDGASSTRVFFHIVVPMSRNMIQICIILCITGSLKAFDHPYTMTWGGPGVRSSYLAVYMYRVAFTENYLGRGTAVAITILILAFLFTFIVNQLFSKESV